MCARRRAAESIIAGRFLARIGAFMLVCSACAFGSRPWERLNTSSLPCRPFEVVTIRGVSYKTSAIEGRVLLRTADEPLADVRIVLRELGGVEVVAVGTTDASGAFALGIRREGWYQLETCREGFNSIVVPVRLVRSAPAKVISLYVSPGT